MKGSGPISLVRSSKRRKTNFFWTGYPGDLLGYPGGRLKHEKFEKKNVFNSRPLILRIFRFMISGYVK